MATISGAVKSAIVTNNSSSSMRTRSKSGISLPSSKGTFHVAYLGRMRHSTTSRTPKVMMANAKKVSQAHRWSTAASSSGVVAAPTLVTASSLPTSNNLSTTPANISATNSYLSSQTSSLAESGVTPDPVSANLERPSATIIPKSSPLDIVTHFNLNNVNNNSNITELLHSRSKLEVKRNFIAWLNGELRPFFASDIDLLPLYMLPDRISHWRVRHAVCFVATVGFPKVAHAMRRQEIDGQALLLLKPNDLTYRFGMRPEPAARLAVILSRLNGTLKCDYLDKMQTVTS